MKTRSQTKEQRTSNEFVHDFDESSQCWKANKQSIGNGSYKYVCAKTSCKNKCQPFGDYCKKHSKSLTSLANTHSHL